jgi:adenylate kinase family enzyme
MILKSRVRFHDMRCLITFAWAVVGVLMEKSVHLSKWGMHRNGEAQAASKQRQFVRWLKNGKIVPAEIYKRLAQTAFADWGGTRFIWLWMAAACGMNLSWYG